LTLPDKAGRQIDVESWANDAVFGIQLYWPYSSPGGVLYCDWLNRIDPYNLYPFLAVLPSGGMFVTYHNEARILDEGMLQTLRALPKMPGVVNDFLGGRTYPFEGKSVLLPQHGPYGNPLTVLIYGGSAPVSDSKTQE
jgi:hypothetical protein